MKSLNDLTDYGASYSFTTGSFIATVLLPLWTSIRHALSTLYSMLWETLFHWTAATTIYRTRIRTSIRHNFSRAYQSSAPGSGWSLGSSVPLSCPSTLPASSSPFWNSDPGASSALVYLHLFTDTASMTQKILLLKDALTPPNTPLSA